MAQLLGCLLLFAALWRLTDLGTAAAASIGVYTTFLALRVYQCYVLCRLVKDIPGSTYLLTPFASLASLFLPEIPYINANLNSKVNDARVDREAYDKRGSSIISLVSALPPRVMLEIADPVAIKAITSDRKTYPKPLEMYKILAVYGQNILVTEGDEWRKHRRIVGSAFNEKANALDWEQSTWATQQWIEDLHKSEDGKGTTIVSDVRKLCLHLTLCILCATSFGVTIAAPGQEEDEPWPGHPYSFKETLEGALRTLLVTVATPKWLKWLPLPVLKRAKAYKRELDSYIREMIETRREALGMGEERNDLLSALVRANTAGIDADADEKAGLGKGEVMDEDELAGNLFLVLVAGHETSAHTLSFAMGLLALHPDEQEKLYDEIQRVAPDQESEIPYSDYASFVRAQAILNETLRLYPSVIGIPKQVYTEADSVVPCGEYGPKGQNSIFVPKGSYLSLDVQSLHHDPNNWPEPEAFKPDRFIDTDEYRWNRDAFAPYSAGARSCVGQRFAQVEIVCILVNLCRRYKIRLHPDDDIPRETTDDKRSRILKNQQRLTLTPLNVRLAFERRHPSDSP